MFCFCLSTGQGYQEVSC